MCCDDPFITSRCVVLKMQEPCPGKVSWRIGALQQRDGAEHHGLCELQSGLGDGHVASTASLRVQSARGSKCRLCSSFLPLFVMQLVLESSPEGE